MCLCCLKRLLLVRPVQRSLRADKGVDEDEDEVWGAVVLLLLPARRLFLCRQGCLTLVRPARIQVRPARIQQSLRADEVVVVGVVCGGIKPF